MDRRLFHLVGVFLLLAATSGLAQQPEAAPAAAVPAATLSEVECSGFIASGGVPKDLYVLDGADNDTHHDLHQFVPGSFIYLHSRGGQSPTVGAEYRLVRPANELMLRTSWYSMQRWSIRALGRPYEDVGRAKVISVTPQGTVAEVTFACGAIRPRDLAIPYAARAIPEYTPSSQFDRFAPSTGRPTGVITAGANSAGFLGVGTIVYVNLGESNGARPGQRYRILHTERELLWGGLLVYREKPRESLGELVILSTQEKSSVGIVVTSLREIPAGSEIELE